MGFGLWPSATGDAPCCLTCGGSLCEGCCADGEGVATDASLVWGGGVTSAGGCDTCDELPAGTYSLGPEIDFGGGCEWGYESAGTACDGDCTLGGATNNGLGCDRSCAVGGTNDAPHCRGTFRAELINNGDGTCSITLDACIFVCEGNNSTGGETGYCAAGANYASTSFATGANCPGTYTLTLIPGSDYVVNPFFPLHNAFCAGGWPGSCTLTI